MRHGYNDGIRLLFLPIRPALISFPSIARSLAQCSTNPAVYQQHQQQSTAKGKQKTQKKEKEKQPCSVGQPICARDLKYVNHVLSYCSLNGIGRMLRSFPVTATRDVSLWDPTGKLLLLFFLSFSASSFFLLLFDIKCFLRRHFPLFFSLHIFRLVFYRTMNVRNVGYVDVSLLFSLLFNLSTIHVCIFCRSGSHTHTRTDKHSTTTVSLQSLVVPAEQSPAVLYTLLTSLRRAQAPHRRYIRQYRHRQSIECVNRFQRKILLRPMPSRRSPLHVDPR